MILKKVLSLSDCSAESKGWAICGEKSDLRPLCAVLLPQGCCPVLLTAAASWLTARMQALISAIEQIRLREPGGPGGVCRWKPLGWTAFRSKGPHAGLRCNLLSLSCTLLATNCFLWEAGIAVCSRAGEDLCHLHWQGQKMWFWETWV